MVEERLQAGEQEHQRGVEVALPQRGIFIPHEPQKKAGKEEEDLSWSSEAPHLGVACFGCVISAGFHPVSRIFFFSNLLLFDFAIVGGTPAPLW